MVAGEWVSPYRCWVGYFSREPYSKSGLMQISSAWEGAELWVSFDAEHRLVVGIEFMSSTRSLRITQVVCSDSFAGVEQYITNVSTSLAARGHSVSIVGGSEAAMRRASSNQGVTYRPAVTIAQAATGLLRQRRSDTRLGIVHAHMVEAEIAAVVTKPFVGDPVVATLHFSAAGVGRAHANMSSIGCRRRSIVNLPSAILWPRSRSRCAGSYRPGCLPVRTG